MKKKNNLPVYDFGSWLGENAMPLLQTAGGAALVATGVGIPAGVGMMAGGVGQMANNALTPDQQMQPQQLPTTIANRQYAPTFAMGGPMPQVYEGQSHLGPNGGIPIDGNGNPSVVSKNRPIALVENNEVSWMSPQGTPYIFSDKLGFAKQAKSIMNKYKMRLGENFDKTDSIATTGLNGELANLMNKQEVYKQENGYHTMPDGSTMSDKEMGSYCNGGKLKYGCGGKLPKYADGGFPDYLDFSNVGVNNTEIPVQPTLYPQLGMSTSFAAPTLNLPRYQPVAVGEKVDAIPSIYPKSISVGNSSLEESLPSVSQTPVVPSDFTNTVAGNLNPTKTNSPFDMSTMDYLGYGLQALSPLANMAMTLANKPKEIKPSYVAPETINLESQRDALRRDATTAANVNRRNARGGSFYNYYSNALAGSNAAQRGLGEGLSQSYLNEAGTNLQSRERAKLTNLEQDRYFENLNSQEQGAYLSNLAGSVSQAGQFGAGFMRDRNQMKSTKMAADAMGTTQYNYDTDPSDGQYKQYVIYKGKKTFIQ